MGYCLQVFSLYLYLYYLSFSFPKFYLALFSFIIFFFQDLKLVCEYEQTMGGIILNPEPHLDHSSLQTERKPSHLYFPSDNPHTISHLYWRLFATKAHYVMRLIEIRIGQELLLKVRTARPSIVKPHMVKLCIVKTSLCRAFYW